MQVQLHTLPIPSGYYFFGDLCCVLSEKEWNSLAKNRPFEKEWVQFENNKRAYIIPIPYEGGTFWCHQFKDSPIGFETGHLGVIDWESTKKITNSINYFENLFYLSKDCDLNLTINNETGSPEVMLGNFLFLAYPPGDK